MRPGSCLLIASALACAGCDGDETNNPSDQAPADTGRSADASADSGMASSDTGVADGGFRAQHDAGFPDRGVGADAMHDDASIGDAVTMGGRDAMAMGPADSDLPPIPDVGGPGMMTECSDYCMNVEAFCAGADQVYADAIECEIACQATRTLGNGPPGATSGNTIECRQTWAISAQASPAVACRNASPSGGGVCGSYCEVYCDYTQQLCFPAIYPSRGDCMIACAGFDTGGASNAFSGDSVQCRVNHAVLGGSAACTDSLADQQAVNGACQ